MRTVSPESALVVSETRTEQGMPCSSASAYSWVGRRRAHPSVALARAGVLQRAVRGRATLGDAEDGDHEGLIGVAERKIAAIAPPTILIRRFGKKNT